MQMNKTTIIIFGFCALLAAGPIAHATNGMRTIGSGPVQRSMAGAGTALPLDSAAVTANPAAISQLDRRLDIGVTYFAPDVAYKAHSDLGMVARDGVTIASRTNPCWIPTAGVILPLNDKWVFGASLQGACGMGVDYPPNLYYNVTYTQYEQMRLAPALAYSINDRLAVGAAVSLDYARMEYEAGSPLEVPHEDGEAFGLGGTFGSFCRLTDRVSAALVYETKQEFEGFTFCTPFGRDTLALDQPQSIAFGLGIHPTAKLQAALDVVWIDWPQTVGKNLPAYTRNSSGAAAWNMDWNEQLVYRVGAQWDLGERVMLRAGYNYGKHPLDSRRAFENIAFPAIAEQHIAAGCGLKLSSRWVLNVGAVYAPKVTFSTANAAQLIDRARIQMSQYSVDVGLAHTW
jgi:long-chain fatty acid transport protein